MVNGNSAVWSKLFKCIQYRRLRGKLGIQKMANLPSSRLMEVPPFSYCGVDMFGQFIIKQRQSEVKWYGAMFRCKNSHAVHIEVTHSLDNDSFIHWDGWLQEEGILEPFTKTMEAISLEQRMNYKGLLKKWMIKRYKHSCKNLVEIGSSGNETCLLQATWVVSGKDKYPQFEGFCLHCYKLMVKPLMKSPCWHWWLRQKEY